MKYSTSSTTLATVCDSSASSNNSLTSLGRSNPLNRKRRIPKKQVRFAATSDFDQVHEVESFKLLSDEEKELVWYPSKEMSQTRKRQIKELKQAARVALATGVDASVEDMTDGQLTWRGFEDIEQGWCRVEKSLAYTGQVVRFYVKQMEHMGRSDVEELRKLAKSLSKAERGRVRRLGIRDATDVGMSSEVLNTNNSFPSSGSNGSLTSCLKKSSSLNGSGSNHSASGGTMLRSGSKSAFMLSAKGMRKNFSGSLHSLLKKGGMGSASMSGLSPKKNATFTAITSSKQRNAVFNVSVSA